MGAIGTRLSLRPLILRRVNALANLGRRAPRDRTRMIVQHRRVTDRATLLNVSAGWHMHLDIPVARATGKEPEPSE
jgi:hypothetical protein